MKKKKLIADHYEKYLDELNLNLNETIKQVLSEENSKYFVTNYGNVFKFKNLEYPNESHWDKVKSHVNYPYVFVGRYRDVLEIHLKDYFLEDDIYIQDFYYLDELDLHDDEILKRIPEFESYVISNYGRVFKEIHRDKHNCYKSKNHWMERKPHLVDRYYHIDISSEDVKKKDFRINRLVAEAFVKNLRPDIYNIVDHMDNNHLNNKWDNLQWCNSSINTSKEYDDRLRNIESIPVKITYLDTQKTKTFNSVGECGRFLGISTSRTSYYIRTGKIRTKENILIEKVE